MTSIILHTSYLNHPDKTLRDNAVQELKKHLPEGELVTSIHACGILTDKLIEESIRQKTSFAVMPCCHSDSIYIEEEQLNYFRNKTDVIDVARIMHIQKNNYQVHLRTIDSKITYKNRIIVGVPKKI